MNVLTGIFSLGWRVAALAYFFLAACEATAEYSIRIWRTEDGLPQHSGTAVAQAADGNLWVGTFNGLARFNGMEFTRFTVGNTKELPTDDINRLYRDRRGVLWIGTYSGLVSHENGHFRHRAEQERLQRANVRSIAEGSDGEVVVATDRGIWRIDGDRVVELMVEAAEWPTERSNAAASTAGEVYISHGSRLFQMGGGELKLLADLGEPVFSLRVGRDGLVWCGLSSGVKWWKPGEGALNPGIDVRQVRSFWEARNGDWWMASTISGLHRWRGKELFTLDSSNGLESHQAYDVCEDLDGNIWAAVGRVGLVRVRPALFRTYGLKDGIPEPDVISILEGREGEMWLGTFRGPLSVGKNGRWERVGVAGDELSEGVLALCQDTDGTVWAGREMRPLVRIKKDGGIEVEGRSELRTVRVLFRDSVGGTWAGSRYEGVEYYLGGEIQRFNITNGLSDNLITAMAEDGEGTIWIGTQNGLNRLQRKGNRVGRPVAGEEDLRAIGQAGEGSWSIQRYFAKDGLGANRIHCLFRDRDGVLWVGTAGGGLSCLMDSGFETVTSKQGLHSDVIAQMQEDDDHKFWIASTAGIFRVNKQALRRVLSGRDRLVRCVAYGKRDGMVSVGYPGGFHPSSAKTRDGRLWFCTNGGVTVIDPDEAAEVLRPTAVQIEKLIADGVDLTRPGLGDQFLAHSAPVQRTLGGSGKNRLDELAMTVPRATRRLEFHFAGVSLSAPEQTQYRYWLEGYDQEWHESGTARVAFYTQVPPGMYRFHVTAGNADGNWNSELATLAIRIEPTLRQSIWFRVLLVGLTMAAAGGVYAKRVSKMKQSREQQRLFSIQLLDSQEAERKRIASELHDSLGQSLLVIKNRARRATRQALGVEGMRAALNEIADIAGQTVEEVRVIARALRPYQLDTLGLTRAIQGLVRQVAESSNLQSETAIEPIDDLLSKSGEMNLYRVMQEILNNVVKHSGATEIKVSLGVEANKILLRVEDNGSGFEVRTESSATNPKPGLGLRGIQERIRLLDGRCEVQSELGAGTRFRIEVPFYG